MTQTVEQRIANMDANTIRGVMDVIGKQRVEVASARYIATENMKLAGVFNADQFRVYTDRFNVLGSLMAKVLEKVSTTPITTSDLRKKNVRESFFKRQ